MATLKPVSNSPEKLIYGASDPYLYFEVQGDSDPDSLARRFEAALTKLEGLMYAVYGGIPDYYHNTQWWEAVHPRCMWPDQENWDIHQTETEPPEQMERWYYSQPAAIGKYFSSCLKQGPGNVLNADTGYFDWPRTGPLAQQWIRTLHDATFFPNGSVEFGTTGDYGDPVVGDELVVQWTPPSAVASRVASAAFVDSAGSHAMTLSAGVWSYAIADSRQEHATARSWHIVVVTSDETPLTICEPHGTASAATAPADFAPTDDGEPPASDQRDQAAGDSYWYTAFTHVYPYANGLPELLWKTFTGDKAAKLRRCTGTWAFRSWSDIRPGLINVARFCIDAIGDWFEHAPHERGNGMACCMQHPLKFRWSGANIPEHYRSGGKAIDEAGIPRPLSNHPLEADDGSPAARRSWRGIQGAPWNYENNEANPTPYVAAVDYGNDESWRSWPRNIHYVFNGYSEDEEDEWYPGWNESHGARRGLREGDRIDPVHLEEIIAAVDFMIEHGLWWTETIQTCKKTPTDCSVLGGKTMPYISFVNDTILEGEANAFENNGSPCWKEPLYWNGDDWYPYVYFDIITPYDTPSQTLGRDSWSGGRAPTLGGGVYGGYHANWMGNWYAAPTCDDDPESEGYPNNTPTLLTAAVPWAKPTTPANCRNAIGEGVEAGVARKRARWLTRWWEKGPFTIRNPLHEELCDSFWCGSPPPEWMPCDELTSDDEPRAWFVQAAYTSQDPSHTDRGWMAFREGAIRGSAYYLCGIRKNWGGPGDVDLVYLDNNGDYVGQVWSYDDKKHGNAGIGSVETRRIKHAVQIAETGGGHHWVTYYNASMGNCADVARVCRGSDCPVLADANGGWDEVLDVDTWSYLYPWGQESNFEDTVFPPTRVSDLWNPPPSFGFDLWDSFPAPLCSTFHGTDYFGMEYRVECHIQNEDHFPNCGDGTVYLRLDLNLDEDGVPQLYDYELPNEYAEIHMLDTDGDPLSPTVFPDTAEWPPKDQYAGHIYQPGPPPYACTAGGDIITAGRVMPPSQTGIVGWDYCV